jgi:hypothetical protein
MGLRQTKRSHHLRQEGRKHHHHRRRLVQEEHSRRGLVDHHHQGHASRSRTKCIRMDPTSWEIYQCRSGLRYLIQ